MKICMIGDLHFGEKGNSEKFNIQVNELLTFAVSEAKKRGCKVCFQFGDWHDSRSKLDVSTINYSIAGAKTLQSGFDEVYAIVSNHDIYYRDRLDVHSMKILEPYMKVISEPTLMFNDTVIAVPWIADGKMWDDVINMSMKCKYMFAHLELNGFKVNDAYEMEHGYSHKELKHLNRVYTGHYHTPQEKDNVTYLGTPYPITMNEANGTHGIYFLDTVTGDCEFVQYGKVVVASIPHTELAEFLKTCDPDNTYVRVEFPDDLSDETLISEAQALLKESGVAEHKIKYTDTKTKTLLNADVGNVKEVENIDEVVITFLTESSDIAGIDKEMLGEIYIEAVEMENANA